MNSDICRLRFVKVMSKPMLFDLAAKATGNGSGNTTIHGFTLLEIGNLFWTISKSVSLIILALGTKNVGEFVIKRITDKFIPTIDSDPELFGDALSSAFVKTITKIKQIPQNAVPLQVPEIKEIGHQ